VADGDYAEIQCTGAAPEDEGKIQWYFNNRVCIDFNLNSSFFFSIRIRRSIPLKYFYLAS
jgi:hypothetical protein